MRCPSPASCREGPEEATRGESLVDDGSDLELVRPRSYRSYAVLRVRAPNQWKTVLGERYSTDARMRRVDMYMHRPRRLRQLAARGCSTRGCSTRGGEGTA